MTHKDNRTSAETLATIERELDLGERWDEHARIGDAIQAIANVIEACHLMHPKQDVPEVPGWIHERINDMTANGMVDALREVGKAHARQTIDLRTRTSTREAEYRSRLADAVGATFDADEA